MPAALEADRPLCQALILQGFTPGQVARKTGLKVKTIETWASRYGWRDAVRKTQVILKETKTPDLAVQVAKASTQARQHLADDLVEQTGRLRQRKPGRTIDDDLKRAELARRLADGANRVFQWDQQSSSQLVSVETMLDLETAPRPMVSAPLPNAMPAIEAPSDCVSDAKLTQDVEAQRIDADDYAI